MQPSCTFQNESSSHRLRDDDEDTDPAPSMCNTCHDRKIMQDRVKHEANHHKNKEMSVQLARTEKNLRFEAKDDYRQREDLLEDRSSLSARMHYATSSFSSNVGGFQDSASQRSKPCNLHCH